MMEDFDAAVSGEEVEEKGSKLGLIAVFVGIIGIAVGVVGIVLANMAQSEVRSLEARLAAKPDKTEDIQKTVAGLDERLVTLGGEFVKLGRADRQLQESTQKAFTTVTGDIAKNREAINGLTGKLTELVGKLENWQPSRAARIPAPASAEAETVEGGEPAAEPGTLTEDGIYTIQSGDTFSSVAKKMGVSLSQLMTANPTANPNALQIGQRIVIPKP